jgi:hypothetical protein
VEKILVSGDSWSNPNFKSRMNPEYKQIMTWSDMLDGDVTNISINGLDNVSIVNNALKSIYENKPDRVVLALSCWSRYSTPNYRMNPLFLFNVAVKTKQIANYEYDKKEYTRMIRHLAGMMDTTIEEGDDVYGFVIHFIKDNIPKFILNTSLALMNIIHICNHLKIKLHIFQTFSAFSCATDRNNNRKMFEKELISSDLFLELYDNKADLIGYPWIQSAGGFTADSVLNSKEDILGNGDGHPNQNGHRKIGEWFNETHKDYEI